VTETTRIARADDFEPIWSLLRGGYEESKIAELSEDRARTTIRNCLQPELGGAVAVACEHGRIVGTIGLLVTQPIWSSDEWALVCLWHFVHPEHRASRHAINLLDQAEAAARQLKLRLFMGIDSPDRIAGKCRLYERRYRKIGYLYLGGE
jgi:GNAT superfamily N-acetyltransferase